jgi:hypothetical protein
MFDAPTSDRPDPVGQDFSPEAPRGRVSPSIVGYRGSVPNITEKSALREMPG